MHLVVIGLSLSSSWGNGHATTYRALLKAFAARGHRITFLERDQPWYAPHRDLPNLDFCDLIFYKSPADIDARLIEQADIVMVGSYVADGCAIGAFVQDHARASAFYDIDTPVTLAKLDRGDFEYIEPALIPGYDVYLSFTGGPTLDRLEREWGSPAARALYCSVDPDAYQPADVTRHFDLGYLGTYSPDRQPPLERLLLTPARCAPQLRFVVAGPQYPKTIAWPDNVEYHEHIPPRDHADFYTSCRFTLNITRADMIRAGYSPSVRLFEAAACATPIISDRWDGLETVLEPGREIALAATADDVLTILQDWPKTRGVAMGEAGRACVLAQHTAAHRAAELDHALTDAIARRPVARRRDQVVAAR